VQRVRKTQLDRAGSCNAKLTGDQLDEHCQLTEPCLTMLEAAVHRFRLSARAYQRIRRVARTIADLAGASSIAPPHVAEALSLRELDRRVGQVSGITATR